jgi:hypothetical protein
MRLRSTKRVYTDFLPEGSTPGRFPRRWHALLGDCYPERFVFLRALIEVNNDSMTRKTGTAERLPTAPRELFVRLPPEDETRQDALNFLGSLGRREIGRIRWWHEFRPSLRNA